VEAFPKAGKSDKLYFDKKSGLLTREETTVSAALVGELTFRSDYGDFRTVDGVKAPFEMRLPEPAELGFSIKFTEVKHNTPIDDSVFNRP
jgi:outer membrane lipoprotein-sorting protein